MVHGGHEIRSRKNIRLEIHQRYYTLIGHLLDED